MQSTPSSFPPHSLLIAEFWKQKRSIAETEAATDAQKTTTKQRKQAEEEEEEVSVATQRPPPKRRP